MKLSKQDRKIFSAGRTAGRAAEKKRSKGRQTVELGAKVAAAWGSQKFLSGKTTPMLPNLPLQYGLGGTLVFVSMWGRGSETKDLLGSIGEGMVIGQLAVDASKNPGTLPGY